MLSIKELDYMDITDITALAQAHNCLNGKLAGSSVCLAFLEPSTRTQLSFSLAAQQLGMDIGYFDRKNSALEKGEDFVESFKAIEDIGFDCIVLRYSYSWLFEELNEKIDIKIINAGDGEREHPTQALVDWYTIKQEFQSSNGYFDAAGLKVAIVGDINYSRVAKSLIYLLNERGANVRILPKYTFESDSMLLNIDNPFKYMDEVVDWKPDIIYMLRDQKERWDGQPGPYFYADDHFQLGPEHLQGAKIMHPGPVNIGSEIVNSDIIDHPDSLIRKQARNGVRVRKAVIVREFQK